MEIYVSSINFVTPDIRKISEIVPKMLNAGINNIEISSIHPYEPGLVERLAEWSLEAKLLIHNFAPPSEDNLILNLSSQNPTIRKDTSQFIKDRIKLCKKLDIDYYSFHAGFCVEYEFSKKNYSNIMQRKDALDVYIKELRDIANFAKRNRVHIGIENHVSKSDTQQFLFLDDIDDFDYFFNQLDNNHVHLHLDFGHLNVSANTRQFSRKSFIQKFSDKILAVHVHDNNGLSDEHLPLTPDSWILEEIKELNQLRYVILETDTRGNLDKINEMIDLISCRFDSN